MRELEFAVDYDKDRLLHAVQYMSGSCSWLLQNESDLDSLSDVLKFSKVERLLNKLQLLSRSLRTIHNRRTAVHKLPPELLGSIFGFATDLRQHQRFSSNFGTPDRLVSSRTLAAVCRHWRDIATDTPDLWSFVSLSSASPKKDEFYNLSLQRSGISPLTVQCDSRKWAFSQRSSVFAQAVLQMHRVQDLRLAHGRGLKMISELFSNAPRLQTLALVLSSEISEDEVALFKEWQTPLVENLMVDGFHGWLNKGWTYLRCLCIKDLSFSSSGLTMRFLDLLMSSGPTLEELALIGIHMSADEPELLFGYHRDVKLCRLDRLVIESESNKFLCLLSSRLILPVTCSLQFYTGWSLMEYSNLIHRSSCYRPRRFFISGRRRIGVRGSSAFYTHNHSFTSFELASIPIHDVNELWLSKKFLWADESVSIWQQVFDRMADLRKLVLMDDLVVGEYKTKLMASAFPLLEELHIHQYSALNDLNQIHGCLQRRRDAGWTVPKVIVYFGPKDSLGQDEIQTRWADWIQGPAKEIPVEVVTQSDTGNGPPQMEIPEICSTPSPYHGFWIPECFRGHDI